MAIATKTATTPITIPAISPGDSPFLPELEPDPTYADEVGNEDSDVDEAIKEFESMFEVREVVVGIVSRALVDEAVELVLVRCGLLVSVEDVDSLVLLLS